LSNGPVEGWINWLKTIKRRIHGPASLVLLRTLRAACRLMIKRGPKPMQNDIARRIARCR